MSKKKEKPEEKAPEIVKKTYKSQKALLAAIKKYKEKGWEYLKKGKEEDEEGNQIFTLEAAEKKEIKKSGRPKKDYSECPTAFTRGGLKVHIIEEIDDYKVKIRYPDGQKDPVSRENLLDEPTHLAIQAIRDKFEGEVPKLNNGVKVQFEADAPKGAEGLDLFIMGRYKDVVRVADMDCKFEGWFHASNFKKLKPPKAEKEAVDEKKEAAAAAKKSTPKKKSTTKKKSTPKKK